MFHDKLSSVRCWRKTGGTTSARYLPEKKTSMEVINKFGIELYGSE